MNGTPSILFACIHNSGRSVAAHMLTKHYGGDALDVRSAGSEPGSNVNPVVAQVLAERGLRVVGHVPTQLDADLVESSDVVVTMGCGETCPVFPGRHYEDWPVHDPGPGPRDRTPDRRRHRSACAGAGRDVGSRDTAWPLRRVADRRNESPG